VCADHLATYALDMQISTEEEPAPLLPLPRDSPYLIYDGVMQTRHEHSVLHRHYARSQRKEYTPVDKAQLDGRTTIGESGLDSARDSEETR
jgi:hypothetical protein